MNSELQNANCERNLYFCFLSKNLVKKLIFPTLVAISLLSFAQSPFLVGVAVSIDRCRLSNGYGQPSSIAKFYTEPGLGFQAGVRLRYDATKRFSLQTGFSMVSHSVKSEKIELNYSSYSGFQFPESYQQEETNKALQVPLLFSFYVGHKWKVGFTIGPAYNYVYRDDLKIDIYFPSGVREFNYTHKVTSQNQFLSGICAFGVEYNLPHWAFRIEPTLNSQLFFFDNKSANEKYQLWSAGLALSGFYRF